MPKNRVEALEERVDHLENMVAGLRDELVESKRRLRELEGDGETTDVDIDNADRSDQSHEEEIDSGEIIVG